MAGTTVDFGHRRIADQTGAVRNRAGNSAVEIASSLFRDWVQADGRLPARGMAPADSWPSFGRLARRDPRGHPGDS